ncbi:cell division protein ZapB [Neobacillus rhizophilus]|uniref:Uncharacterized protein n=1 Tax=Neobacillus rhizophilus TaxID=2833579 RepID=A0A942U9M8_9BACI|nr:cell division protein ZapB [Neobacillus rhizophilus]MBS4214931.1 hypothetical protein [Neobacillus rhizophilus]
MKRLMSPINNILSLLENELQKLTAAYENKLHHLQLKIQAQETQMNELKKENRRLVAEVDSLLSDNRQFREQLSQLSKQNSEILDKSFQANAYHELIDELFLSSSLDDSLLILGYCLQALEHGHFDRVQYILELLNYKPNPLLHMDSRVNQMLESIFDKLIATGKKNFDEEVEKNIVCIFDLMSKLYHTHLKKQISQYLLDHYSQLWNFLLYANEPKSIIPFLRLLIKFELLVEFKKTMKQLIHSEWEFLDYHVSQEEFYIFIWYAFLIDMDQTLIDKAEESLKWLSEKQSTIELYTFMYDCINADKIKSKEKLNLLLDCFRQNEIFNDHEKHLILDKVDRALLHLVYESEAVPYFTGKLYIVKPDELQALIEMEKLQSKKMLVPLLRGKGVNIISRYIELPLYFKGKNSAFISTKTEYLVNQKYEPKVLRAKEYNKVIIPIKPSDVKQSTESFPWPSTEIQESQHSDSHEQPTLNESSDLKVLGYQITGQTRAKRWSILEKAVPKLGLKKVAYTIAYQVKLRKGQKNGFVKYKNAITEWEYDLDKLKKLYYKNDFTWPSV